MRLPEHLFFVAAGSLNLNTFLFSKNLLAQTFDTNSQAALQSL